MAKINWVFQNESGTNLNRYKAINVYTGEEVVFDLTRNGNISIIGTPLSAENLNQLITAINDLYDTYYSKDEADKTFVKQTGGEIKKGNLKFSDGYGINFGEGAWTSNEDGYVKIYTSDNTMLVGDGSDERWFTFPSTGGVFALTKDYYTKSQSDGKYLTSSSLNGLAQSSSIGVVHIGSTTDETTFLNSQKTNGVYVYTYSSKKYARMLYVYVGLNNYVSQTIIYESSGMLKIRKRYYSSSVWKEEYDGDLIYDGKIISNDITTSTTIDPTLDKNAGLYRITTRHSSYGTSTGLYEAYWNDPDSDEELTFTLIGKDTTNVPGINMPTQDDPHFTAKDGYTIVKMRKIATYS